MKFLYSYKSKDGVRHEDEICASSREAVYSTLRAKGIKPIRVDLAPGLLNRIQSLGKRWLAIGVLVVLAVAALLYARSTQRTLHTALSTQHSPTPRHQIFGDPVLIGELERSDFASVFASPAERFLARYAQPGRAVKGMGLPVSTVILTNLVGCLDAAIEISQEEDREVRELKQIVLWMKDELRRYLAAGTGSPEKYVERLNERQRREQQIYAVAQNDLRKTKNVTDWERINKSLKSIGLPTIPRPGDPEYERK